MVFLKKALTSTTCAAPKNRGLNLQVNPKKSKHPGVKKWLFVFENCLKLDSVTNVKLSGWHTTEKFDVMFPQHVLLINNNIKKQKIGSSERSRKVSALAQIEARYRIPPVHYQRVLEQSCSLCAHTFLLFLIQTKVWHPGLSLCLRLLSLSLVAVCIPALSSPNAPLM